MEKPRPALRGGVAGRGARKRPPAFILHIFRPPGSPVTFGGAEFTGWRTLATRFGHGCVCGGRRLVTLPTPAGPHSGAQVVAEDLPLFTATQFLRTPILLFPSPADAARFADEHPTPLGTGGWCRADFRCA